MDRDAPMKWSQTILSRPVVCTVTPLDDGIHVLLTGGDKSHVGAVSVCDPGQLPETMTFPGHKEQYITVHWSETIAAAAQQRCCVVCGIHYDHATPAEIETIMAKTGEMLQQVLLSISPIA